MSGKLGWRHAFGDHRPETALSFKDGPGFTVTGLPLARNEALASANLAFTLSDKATLNLSYDGAFSSTTRTNTLSLGLNVKF